MARRTALRAVVAGYFEAGGRRLTAPPGTVIDRPRITRSGYRAVATIRDDVGHITGGTRRRRHARDRFRGIPGGRRGDYPFGLGSSRATTVRVR